MARTLLFLAALAFVVALTPTAAAQPYDGPMLYVTEYKIQQGRLDSLEALTRRYDVPWHAELARRVPGYQRYFYRHDTGGEYNWVIVTMFPNWDMIRGDEIDYDGFFEDFQRREGFSDDENREVDEMFRWAFEGSSHEDNIYRPVTADNGDRD